MDLEKHYEESRKNYKDLASEGAESHMEYYRNKYPNYYKTLLRNEKFTL